MDVNLDFLKCHVCGLRWRQVIKSGRMLAPYQMRPMDAKNAADNVRKYHCVPSCEHVGDVAMRLAGMVVGGED